MHDINVIGTLQLLAACEQTPTIKAVVVRGSAGIYGAEPAAPQFYTEEMARLYPLRTRFQRDIGEIENYFEGFSRRHPEVICTMLRYQPSLGPGTDSQVTRYLNAPVVPTYLGFDPRLQFVHEYDGIEALLAAIRNPVRGAVNVAAPGTIGLTKMLRLTGKISVPVPAPAFAMTLNAGRRIGMPAISPDFRRLLRFGRAVDITELVEEVGYTPRFSATEAVEDYARHQGARRAIPSIRHLAVSA
jgi:UDP-glucose 4-epimerase